jgi:hypothetical protein
VTSPIDADAIAPAAAGGDAVGGELPPGPAEVAPAGGRRLLALEWVLGGGIAAATLLVHDLHHILSQPYWIDEAWAADSVRVPLTEAPAVTASSPLGWTVLLHFMVIGGPQRQRLVPLLLLAAATVVAYLLGRRSPLPKPVGGALAAGALLLLPHALLRNDLKQYTSDACCALLLLLLAARAEERPTRARLAVLVLAVPLTMLFSHPALLVGAAVLLGLAGATLLRRAWLRLLEVVLGGLLATAGMALVYAKADRPHVIKVLADYWRHYYLPTDDGVGGAWRYISARWTQLHALTNLGPGWLAALLIVAGLVTLARAGRLSLALSVPVLLAGTIAASAQHKYPLLDQRTSLFLFAILAVVAAIGVAGVAHAVFVVARWSGDRRGGGLAVERGGRRGAVVGVVAAAAILVGSAVAYAIPASEYVREQTVPLEDVPAAVAWVQEHIQPQDVVVVEYGASFGYAYYATGLHPRFVPNIRIGTGFALASDDAQRLVFATPTRRTAAGVLAAIAHARTLLGPSGRIYVVRSHETPPEGKAFDQLRWIEQRDWIGASVTVL